jgi:hypothetical protein
MATRQFTNREDVFINDPENWEYVPDADKPAGTSESPSYPAGATEPTMNAPGAQQGGPEMQPAQVPPDPRLGMNPQGEWTKEKMQVMFPEMFKLDTSDWLDPAEEAKRREGLPYDATKKYDETKLYPGINAPAIGGLDRADTRPSILKMSREQWEQQIFQKIGGNPALFNPYNEVIKADKNLPELFNHVFQGRVQWSDLAKLDKDERAYWEKMKKEYHQRVFEEAKMKKQQMVEAYKYMMANWAWDQKQAAAEFARQDKLRAKQEAAAGKAPPHQMLYNDAGVLTLHERQPDGSWRDTGKRGKDITPRDVEPPAVKAARKELEEIMPPMSKDLQNALGFMSPEMQKKFMEGRLAGITPEKQRRAHEIASFLEKYNAQARAKVLQELEKSSSKMPGAEKPAAAEKPNPMKDIVLIVNAKKAQHPKLKEAIVAFVNKYPDAATQGKLQAALRKIKGPHFTPGAGENY